MLLATRLQMRRNFSHHASRLQRNKFDRMENKFLSRKKWEVERISQLKCDLERTKQSANLRTSVSSNKQSLIRSEELLNTELSPMSRTHLLQPRKLNQQRS